MVGLKHYPDKPFEHGPESIPGWDDGCHLCQQKVDGWRLETCKDFKGRVNFISRSNTLMNSEVESYIQEQMALLLAELSNGCQLDGEWLSRREATNKKTKPRLVLFDVIRYERRWLLQEPYEYRWELMQEIFAKVDPALMPDISLVETAKDGEFAAFYEAQKTLAHSEGIVVKHKQSFLLGDRNGSKDNPMWLKVLYRASSSGNMTTDHLRSAL